MKTYYSELTHTVWWLRRYSNSKWIESCLNYNENTKVSTKLTYHAWTLPLWIHEKRWIFVGGLNPSHKHYHKTNLGFKNEVNPQLGFPHYEIESMSITTSWEIERHSSRLSVTNTRVRKQERQEMRLERKCAMQIGSPSFFCRNKLGQT